MVEQLVCPLCKQPVSKNIYDKITGVWDAKEKELKKLEEKKKELIQKEKSLKIEFDNDKKKLIQTEKNRSLKVLENQKKSFDKQLIKQKGLIQKEKGRIEKEYKNNLAREINKIKQDEKRREKELKLHFDTMAKSKIATEKQRLAKQKSNMERIERNLKDKNNKLVVQFRAMQTKNQSNLEKSNNKIKLLEEQLKKNQTPQMLGLLNESEFLAKLKQDFPHDEFIHTGKGGDIVHKIIEKDKAVGTIVYELKKVSHFNKDHITQTFEAQQKREADYGVLVTNAKRNKEDMGFSTVKGIIIIHPAGALVLIGILRQQLIQISRLKLSQEERNKAIKLVLDYVQGATFKNSIENIIEDTKELYENMSKEVKEHIKIWNLRIHKYKNINFKANEIHSHVVQLLSTDKKEQKKIEQKTDIKSIDLPNKIE
ncbi:MAG: DUF2130 domain-containing protein [Nanoarchaeota archaeon]|nr:DUF2130 domain-containing protein [Nanoarchaeota archaeon]